jgi:flagellar biosynthesis/type III secretory pathway chaperone
LEVNTGVAACREALESILSTEVAQLSELAGLLDREHELLVANDIETLEGVMAQRQESVGKLLGAEEERRNLCRMHGRGVDAAGVLQLMAWCDPRGTLRARWEECARGATRCRELNDRNGALVIARMKRVETLLTALTGQQREVPTYGPKGAYAADRSGRMLTIEA